MAEKMNGDTICQDATTTHVDMEVEWIPEEEKFSFVNQTFAQDMLREMIVNYAIRTNEGKLCGKYVAALRSLGKCWQLSVSKVLRQNNEPLFNISLTKDNSLNGTRIVLTQGKLLDQFVNSYKETIYLPYPTYRLSIEEECFQFENYDSFNTCLLHCSQGLVELTLKVPQNGGSLPCIFSNLSLPNLAKLSVQFRDTVLTIPENAEFAGHSANVTLLLHSILNKNESLKELAFPFYQGPAKIPVGFQYIYLPSSLTKLELKCKVENRELEILARASLPNLTTLLWMVPHVLYPEGLLSRILENFRKTLHNLEIHGLVYVGPPRVTNFVRFPVMQKLEYFRSLSINWELESDLGAVQNYFPKLKYLEIFYQSQTMFRKWTAQPSSSKVETLCAHLVNEAQSQLRYGYNMPITLENMQRLHLTFPNVHSLTLKLTGDQVCGLKYLFMEMKQLTYLCLYVAEADRIVNSDLWDSILIGVPIEIIAGIRVNQDFLKHMDIRNQEVPSVRMLTGLKTLCLRAWHSEQQQTKEIPNDAPSLISDLTFDLALLLMPVLRSLYLSGRFKASEKSADAWKRDKRSYNYTAPGN